MDNTARIIYTGVEPDDLNPYVRNVARTVKQCVQPWQVSIRADLAPPPPGPAALLHIQWPEALVPRWKTPTDQQLQTIARWVATWQRRAPIVCTVHNELPHHRSHPNDRRLRDLVWNAAAGFVHLGPATQSVVGRATALHRVIPHPVPKFSGYAEGSTALYTHPRLHPDWPKVLVFGQVRSAKEIQRLRTLYAAFKGQINLLVPQFYRGFDNIADPPSRWYYRSLAAMGTFRRPGWCVEDRVVPSEAVAAYFRASDLVLINRYSGLNSGNIYLALAYQRVVVGPELGNIGSELRALGQPTFALDDGADFIRAVRTGLAFSQAGHGTRSRVRLLERHADRRIGEAHVALYHQLLHV